MPGSQAYLEHSRKFRELAKTAETDEERDLMLKIAGTWNWIAEEGEIPFADRSCDLKQKAVK